MSRDKFVAARAACALSILALVLSCVGATEVPLAPAVPDGPALAKVSAGIAVTSTTPPYGHRGEINKPVTITGSGFAPGATVTWERNGVVDPNIIVQTASFVSSTRLDATITISDAAQLTLYDVGVMNLDRKKGVGTEQFEVTTAVSLGSLGTGTQLNATNDNSSGVQGAGTYTTSGGMRAFYWPDANGKIADLGLGDARGISQDGSTIAGIANEYAVVWKLSGSTWTQVRLPLSPGIVGSHAKGMVSNADGSVLIVAGSEKVSVKGGSTQRPRLWRLENGLWSLDSLPSAANLAAWAANLSGEAVGGGLSGPATFWDAAGNATLLPGAGAGARAISADGSVVAGFASSGNATVAVYWKRTRDGSGPFGPWTSALTLPGSCEAAIGIDSQNRIIGQRCRNSANRVVSVVFRPPYDAASMITLNGTGNKADGGTAWSISPNGSLIGGRGIVSGSDVAVIWQYVLP